MHLHMQRRERERVRERMRENERESQKERKPEGVRDMTWKVCTKNENKVRGNNNVYSWDM